MIPPVDSYFERFPKALDLAERVVAQARRLVGYADDWGNDEFFLRGWWKSETIDARLELRDALLELDAEENR